MREEFGESVGLSVLSLRLVPWRNQVRLELASDVSGKQLLIQVSILFILFIRIMTLLSALFSS